MIEFIRSATDMLKAKEAGQGEVHQWASGPHKKTGKKWIRVARGKTFSQQQQYTEQKASGLYDYSLASNLGGVLDQVLQGKGIKSYADLVERIKAGDASEAHRVYKDAVDAVRSASGSMGDKKAVLDLFGRALLRVRDQYATKPKAKLMMKVTSKKGKEYYTYAEGKHSKELPALKPTVVSAAKKGMGGWTVTGTLGTEHVKEMMRTGAAKLVSGKIDSKREWRLPVKAKDMELKYKGDTLLIRVAQTAKKKGAKRGVVTARVEITIPYAYAKAFLLHQISSVRTRNNFIFRLEHSAGYREFLERAAA